MHNVKYGWRLPLLALLALPALQLYAAETPYAIDIKDLDKQQAPASRKPQPRKHGKTRKVSVAAPEGKEGYLRYTVRPGDHIFKILMVRFGKPEEAAERLIPEIIRINKVSDIKKLQVGQTLLIPAQGKRSGAKAARRRQERREEPAEALALLDRASRLEKQGAAVAEAPPRAPEPTAAAVQPLQAAQTAAPQQAPQPTWICSVTGKDPGKVVDQILNALSISWTRNKIIESGEKAPNPYSIRVDRYFEYRGGRYIVSIGETDPYSYTLIRLLEGAGYRTVTIEPSDDSTRETEKVLRLIGVAPQFGNHPVDGGAEVRGFLVQPDDAGGRRLVITAQKADPRLKWVLK